MALGLYQCIIENALTVCTACARAQLLAIVLPKAQAKAPPTIPPPTIIASYQLFPLELTLVHKRRAPSIVDIIQSRVATPPFKRIRLVYRAMRQ